MKISEMNYISELLSTVYDTTASMLFSQQETATRQKENLAMSVK